jgi:hypothetical protein
MEDESSEEEVGLDIQLEKTGINDETKRLRTSGSC